MEEKSPSGFLFFGTPSRVTMGLVTDEDSRVGKFPGRRSKISDVGNYYYGGTPEKTSALGLYDPKEGKYMLVVSASRDTEYEIFISYALVSLLEKKTKIIGRMKKGEVHEYEITVSPGDSIGVNLKK
jgi:hypothetical protein